MFIILTGSSGVGKNTVIKKLESDYKNYMLMPTYTTREKRPTETNGYPFYFLSDEEFKQKIAENELIEYEYIHNHYYGSSYKILNEFTLSGKTLIKDLGIEGAQALSQKVCDKTSVLKIFLTASKRTLKNRLTLRGEKEIKLRLKRYDKEQKEINKFDYIIYNEDLDITCENINIICNKNTQDLLSTKKIEKINTKKITKYANLLLQDKILKPIKVAVKDNKIYIISGHEKFIAGLLTNKLVAKVIINKKNIKMLQKDEIVKWKNLIKESQG